MLPWFIAGFASRSVVEGCVIRPLIADCSMRALVSYCAARAVDITLSELITGFASRPAVLVALPAVPIPLASVFMSLILPLFTACS